VVGTVFTPYNRIGHRTPVLHGLAGGHGPERSRPSSGSTVMAMVLGVMMRGFCWKVMRVVGGVLIPMLAVCRKRAMRLFCGGKKGINHGKINMVWGCLFCLFASGRGV
jgi:hypothetical protein